MSGLVIKINAGATVEESSVTATGEQVDIIADSERASFGIGSDSDLKGQVEKYFGKWPEDAYLHSPTPWGDLYITYGWDQVQRVIRPIKAEIIEITSKPTILSTKTLQNDSDVPSTFTTSISEQVTNSVSNEWSNSSTLSVSQSISYNMGFMGTGVGGQTSFGFEHTWGNNETVTKEATVSTQTSVSLQLMPRDKAIVELSASSGTMHVRITYAAHLRGMTAINYNPPYKEHHFHALDIGAVLSGPNEVQVVEDIEVGYYSNANAIVKNA